MMSLSFPYNLHTEELRAFELCHPIGWTLCDIATAADIVMMVVIIILMMMVQLGLCLFFCIPRTWQLSLTQSGPIAKVAGCVLSSGLQKI